jgi:fructose-bisphosphate aldolase class I
MTTFAMGVTVEALLVKGKGLLAADESLPAIAKQFSEIGVISTEEFRRSYRETLFTTPELNEFVSGVILFDDLRPLP